MSEPNSRLPVDAHAPRLNSRGRWVYGCPDTWLTWGFPTEEACREFSAMHVEAMHAPVGNAPSEQSS